MDSTTGTGRALDAALSRGRLDRLIGPGSFIRRATARKITAIALVLFLFILFLAIFGPWVSPYGPADADLLNGLKSPSREHLFGTDQFGRDILSRVIAGARIAIQVSAGAVGIATSAGLVLGTLAGFKRGIIDDIIMRFIDAIMAFPSVLFALAILAVLGSSLINIILAIAITSIPFSTRLIRGQVLQVREMDYVLAAHAVGLPEIRIAVRHVLPNILAPVIVQATLSMGWAIIAEASLSFLGVGLPPPASSWGQMLKVGYNYLSITPLWAISSGMAIFITVLSINLFGDGIREALDPRMRGR